MDNQEARPMIDALSAKFDDSQVQSRVDERTGKSLSYISASNIYRRLNEVAPGWEFAITSTSLQNISTKKGQLLVAIVTANMTIPGVGSRMGMGSAPIYAPDDFKHAATDALKRCASLFGVGLYLYGGDEAPQNGYQQPPQQQQPTQMGNYSNQQYQAPQRAPQPQQMGYQQPQQQAPQQQQGSQQEARPYNQQYDNGEMRTEPQSRKLGFELNRVGIDINSAASRANVPFNGGIDDITKSQASAVINWLTSQGEGSGNAGGQQPPQQQEYGNYGGGNDDLSSVPF